MSNSDNEVLVAIPVGSHPDMFGGETRIMKEVPAEEARYFKVEVTFTETIHESRTHTVLIKAHDDHEAEEIAYDVVKKQISEDYEETSDPEVGECKRARDISPGETIHRSDGTSVPFSQDDGLVDDWGPEDDSVY